MSLCTQTCAIHISILYITGTLMYVTILYSTRINKHFPFGAMLRLGFPLFFHLRRNLTCSPHTSPCSRFRTSRTTFATSNVREGEREREFIRDCVCAMTETCFLAFAVLLITIVLLFTNSWRTNAPRRPVGGFTTSSKIPKQPGASVYR